MWSVKCSQSDRWEALSESSQKIKYKKKLKAPPDTKQLTPSPRSVNTSMSFKSTQNIWKVAAHSTDLLWTLLSIDFYERSEDNCCIHNQNRSMYVSWGRTEDWLIRWMYNFPKIVRETRSLFCFCLVFHSSSRNAYAVHHLFNELLCYNSYTRLANLSFYKSWCDLARFI